MLYPRICIAKEEIHIVSTLSQRFLSQLMGPKHSFRRNSRAYTSESPGLSTLCTHIPDFTSWRSLLYHDNGRNEKQWGCFLEAWRGIGGVYCTSFPWVVQQRLLRASWDERTRVATSVQNIQGPQISRRVMTTCPEPKQQERRRERCRIVLLSPPPPSPPHPPPLVRRINSKSF